MEVKNRFVTIKQAIHGSPKVWDFEVRDSSLVLALEGNSSREVIVKNLYLPIDPAQLNRLKTSSSSQTSGIRNTSGIIPGQVIGANGLGRVVASSDPDYEEGDLVMALLAWEEYTVVPAAHILRKLSNEEANEFPLSHYTSVFGTSGLTAYVGFYRVCRPKKGERVLISAAMGSVGNIVGQLAKLHGCYVVGTAGSQQKVDILKEKLGFDDAFNYKEEPDLHSALKRYFPDGIDIYFENIGGEMLEAAVSNMNNFGRIAACGVISEYPDTGKRAAPNMVEVVYKRLTIQGFISVDEIKQDYPECFSIMSDLVRSGKVQVLEDISCGIDSIPSAFVALFEGRNIGKKLIKLE